MLKWVLVLVALCLPVSAKRVIWSCQYFAYSNTETCETYIDPTGIAVTAYDAGASNTQLQSQWCWAASIEMASRYYGFYLTQQQIVETTWGSMVNMPGTAPQIIAATNRKYTDSHGKAFEIKSLVMEDWEDAAMMLANNVPILVGSLGHMTMLIGLEITFAYNVYGDLVGSQVNDAVLWDPWPGNGIRPMTPAEFYNAFFAIAVGAVEDPASIRRRIAPKASKSPFSYNLLGRRLQP
jgi:hypothetical protein